MSDPILSSNIYGNVYLYYTCDRDPTSSEPLVFNDITDLLFIWWNKTTNNFFRCVDNTSDSMIWVKEVDLNNITSILNSMGIFSPIPRSRNLRISPDFNTSYRPSITSDVEVNVTLNVTSLISFSSTVNIQISNDNLSWITISSIIRNSTSGISMNDLYTFTVPIGSYYRLIQSIGTASSIVSIYELTV